MKLIMYINYFLYAILFFRPINHTRMRAQTWTHICLSVIYAQYNVSFFKET